MTKRKTEPTRPDDDLDGCEMDFLLDFTTDEEAQKLLDPASRDRTEAEEEERRHALRHGDR